MIEPISCHTIRNPWFSQLFFDSVHTVFRFWLSCSWSGHKKRINIHPLTLHAMDIHYTSVFRHGILLLFKTSKFFFFLIPVGLLVWIIYRYKWIFPRDFSNFVILPIHLITVNYIFLQLVVNSIDYFGRLMLISEHAILLIHTSLLLVDDIEFMDMKSILKVDVERHGLICNILSYWHLILEQRNDVRRVHYIPHPYTVYQLIKDRIPKKDGMWPI